MSELHENPAPTVPLLAAAALVVITVIGVAVQKFYINPNAERAVQARVVLAERQLQFIDHEDGSVEVLALPGKVVLDVIEAGDGGFLRGALRSLVRERRLANASSTPGFRIQQFSDGAVILTDLATSRQLDLRAFGSINAGDFLRYLPQATDKAALASAAANTNQ